MAGLNVIEWAREKKRGRGIKVRSTCSCVLPVAVAEPDKLVKSTETSLSNLPRITSA